MDIVSKITSLNITDSSIFSNEKFKNSNIITMYTNIFNDNIYYIFSISFANILMPQIAQDKIKDILIKINNEFKIESNFINFTGYANNYDDCDKYLNQIINDIFKIVFENINVSDDTFFGVIYTSPTNVYKGYLLADKIK